MANRSDRRARLTDALMACLTERAGMDKRALLRELHTRGFDADATEMNSVLYRRTDLFRRVGDSPPIWFPAAAGKAQDAGAGSGSPAAPRVKTPALGAAERQRLLRQQDIQPGFKPSGFRLHPFPLGRKPPVESWGDLSSRAPATLEDSLVDRLELTCLPAGLSLSIQRVIIDDYPCFVAWCVPDNRQLAELLRRRGWHVWPREHPCAWDRPDYLTVTPQIPAIATWRSDRAFSAVRAALGLVHDGLELRDLQQLAIRVDLADGAEARHRLLRVHDEAKYRQAFAGRGFKGFVNPVRGACGVCGLPLRDPVSLARGIGPDCWDSFYREFPDYAADMTRADANPLFWMGASALPDFQRLLKSAAAGRVARGADTSPLAR
ncbi:hypothetical protein Cfla_3292 [Cellulomonas flavigena DSM 20109]|uniref:Uncharacterized protein n=1 Tax=Cellulomonas flavigena (strain ATCC 482 / DSM 20109 / BCRC 11376 / JCM 18109 / NBRC 3775 / NCIMB 8073 / NRS 134) TaxID=446466 RepID=D5UC12_CELFN|nr:DUF6011 domain-containing protein [Cellulomonas flavigena]ADG76171.1 hypothetical protein Cfla_3292 [Cellulomonas flavigena DSM 20109]